MQKYFSSGEFAKLTGVNKRTLHYYHDIGLFQPDLIGENGYYYYSVSQFAQLELILTLRRIGLSIEEIESYLKNASEFSFAQMMEQKKSLSTIPFRSFWKHRHFWRKRQSGFGLE